MANSSPKEIIVWEGEWTWLRKGITEVRHRLTDLSQKANEQGLRVDSVPVLVDEYTGLAIRNVRSSARDTSWLLPTVGLSTCAVLIFSKNFNKGYVATRRSVMWTGLVAVMVYPHNAQAAVKNFFSNIQ
eukprot:PhF_6_TR6704/c0_g1_i2/m.9729